MVNQKGEFFGVIIESKEISNTLKILFQLACKNLKEKEDHKLLKPMTL